MTGKWKIKMIIIYTFIVVVASHTSGTPLPLPPIVNLYIFMLFCDTPHTQTHTHDFFLRFFRLSCFLSLPTNFFP